MDRAELSQAALAVWLPGVLMSKLGATWKYPRRIVGKLDERVAVVSGAGRGIGEAITTRFAAEGAQVVVADINSENAGRIAEAITSDGDVAYAVAMDLGDGDSIRDAIRTTVSTFGRLDILVNNAAAVHLAPRDGPVADVDPELWEESLRVNVTGTMLASQHAIRQMVT